MWPPLVRLMTALLSDEDYKKATTTVVCGSSVGTILVYLVSPVLISLIGWMILTVGSIITILYSHHRVHVLKAKGKL